MDEIARRQFLSYQKIPAEVWQVRLVRLLPWADAEELSPLMLGVCICTRTDEIVVEDSEDVEEMADLAVQTLAAAARKWRCRPGTIQTSDPETAEHLRDVLADGVARIEMQELPVLDQVVEGLLDTLDEEEEDDSRPAALSVPGVTVEQMAAFARAAARFFAAAPWRRLSAEDLIRIESPEAEPDLRYAAVMGAEGTKRGLLFFDSPALWEAFGDGDAEAILETGYWSVSFYEEQDLVPEDLDFWDRHDLPRSDGLYPVAERLGDEVERPDAARLTFFEGMLEALAATTEEEMDTGRWEKTVTTHRGALRFILALPDLLAAEAHSEPADGALDFVEDALDARGRRRRLLARRALDLDPDCVDAYLLLAEMEVDLEARRDLLVQGMAVAERNLGPRVFEEYEGSFWLMPETRPYMITRLGLAQTLQKLGEVDGAVGHLQDLLRLNPDDRQGVRYPLLSVLLEAERHEEAAALLDRFGDEASPWWLFSRTLLAFRQEGDSPAARGVLRTALEDNRYVAKYLLDPDLLLLASSTRFEEEGQAILYATHNGELWEETPGALAWLARRRAALGRAPGKKPKAKARHRQAKPRRPKKKKRR